MGISTAFRLLRIPVDLEQLALDYRTIERLDVPALERQVNHLTVLDDCKRTGVMQHGRDIGSKKHLTIADPDNEGTDHPHCHNPARFLFRHRHEGIRALGSADRPAHCFE